jgi:Icc-related predicted phosphoesterase
MKIIAIEEVTFNGLPEDRKLDRLSACYASDLDELIEECQPHLWVHGHIHSSADYRIGKTRIVCNSRGYYPDYKNASFDPMLTIEIA